MPKIKMPNVVGNAKDMGKKIKGEIGNKTKGAVKGIKGLNPFKKQLSPGGLAMMNWRKRLIASYEKFIKEMFHTDEPKRPTVYTNGRKRFIKVKRFSKNPIHRTKYK